MNSPREIRKVRLRGLWRHPLIVVARFITGLIRKGHHPPLRIAISRGWSAGTLGLSPRPRCGRAGARTAESAKADFAIFQRRIHSLLAPLGSAVPRVVRRLRRGAGGECIAHTTGRM